ncbi:HDOD domain-containing protein [Massilia sp. Leaf139]|uniref:HDOD domain-containing protein n=1 Tax=Massilia sp. Leaf139 TaxID=1736272 RepID=UPI0006F92FC6|nr:HDOD domain-containing protein [Massilia sp. Leaf139]KQQ97559.1 histidine kinase [Massilia sp. Leaf139]
MTPATNEHGPQAKATLALLWERIRRQGDMPGFTRAINAILASMRGEDEREFSMTQTVLSDPVLTQKVLRLANSGMYSAFGQRINTVSKAVLVLGTEAIGHLALGLKLIEELSKSTPDSAHAHVEMEKAVLAGMVAQQVAASAATRDPEEAVVCSILHSLGRMMVTFYMPERWSQMQAQAGAGFEGAAAFDVLGLSLEELGRATAEHWGLPRNLVAGMRTLEPGDREDGFGHDDWLAALGTMSTRCASSLWNDDEAGAAEVAELAAAFAPMLGVEPEKVMVAIGKAKVDAQADLTIAPLAKSQEKRAQADAKGQAATRKREAGNRILMSGVADMRDAGGAANPGQMMSMALETIYQGLSFTRAFAFLRNRREGKYLARMGFGDGAKALIPNLSFEDAYEADVFHASLTSDRVIFIENARDPKFAAKLPGWWRGTLSEARCFVVIPMCMNGQPVGFIYGDWDDSFPSVSLSQTEFALLNDLRTLVVNTLERRAQPEHTAKSA